MGGFCVWRLLGISYWYRLIVKGKGVLAGNGYVKKAVVWFTITWASGGTEKVACISPGVWAIDGEKSVGCVLIV